MASVEVTGGTLTPERLLEVGRRLATRPELEPTLRSVVDALVPDLADGAAVHLLDGDTLHPRAVKSVDPDEAARARDLFARDPARLDAPFGLGRAVREGRVELVPDAPAYLDRMVQDPQHRAALAQFTLRALVYAPLTAHGKRIGGLVLHRTRPTGFTREEVLLVEDLAARAAVAIENARLFEALRASELRYRSLLAASTQMVWRADPDGMVEDLPEWRAFTGQRREEVMGVGWASAIHPDDRDRVTRAWWDAWRTRSPYRADYRVRSKDGEYRHFHARGVPIVDEHGRLLEWVGTWTDVTPERRAELALRERDERLQAQNAALVRLARTNLAHTGDVPAAARALVEESARAMGVERVSVWLFSDDKSSIRCIDLFELSPGRHAEGAVLHAGDHPAYFAALTHERTIAADDARTDPRTREFADEYLAPLGISSMLDAPIRVGSDVVGVLCHEHVGPARAWRPEEMIFAGALADLMSLAIEAERRGRAAAQLRESEERFTRLADDAPIGIWLTDAAAKNSFNNRFRLQLLGARPEDLLGDGWMRFVHPEDMEREFGRALPLVAAHQPFQTQHRLRAADGSWRWVVNVAQPRFDGDGSFLGYIGAELDVTERLQAQQEVAQARRELAQGEKLAAMGSLVSGVAHEVRTPLAYIANHAALLDAQLARGAADLSRFQESVRAIQEGVERVNSLVLDLRRFVRAERSPRAPASLADVVGLAGRLFEATHRGRAALDVDLRPTPPLILDRHQVQQVVLNLLENAAEAAPAGSRVRLSTRVVGERVEVRVSDDGPGIPEDVQARMFDPFFTTKRDGTGLGLSIVRRIVESHGARIEVESAPGRGSTFIVSFPLGG